MTPEKPAFQVELPEDQGAGVYANLVMIAHSPSEFILDFARQMPGLPKARVVSRIIMTPQHAKLLLEALQANIKKYEERFGTIRIPGTRERRIGFTQEPAEGGGGS